jgi:glutaredoxin-related protein
MFLWGDKYDVAFVNRLIAAISNLTARKPRFVLLSDRARPGLDARAQLRMIPEVWLHPVFRRGGCQTKLAMFQKGVLDEDIPALYIDLDTVVTGDLTRIMERLPRPDGLMLLQSAIVPLGAVGRFVWRWTKGRKYARGNSSLVVFHPAFHHNIATQFPDFWSEKQELWFRPMIADERFMSWAAQATVFAIPNTLAVKFPTEFMSRVIAFSYLWAILPWVRARRAGLIAVTLCGVEIKLGALFALPEGARVIDPKGRTLIWSDFVLGKARRDIIAFYGDKAP